MKIPRITFTKAGILLFIIYLGFISLGLPDTTLGVAWPFMSADFDSQISYAGYLTTLLTACSAISAFLSGTVLRKIGTGRLLTVCGFMTGGAMLGFALSPSFWFLLLLTLPLGFGQGAVDTGMNFHVARHYSSRHMSWLHGCWGVGATVGPAIMTGLMKSGYDWRAGYGAIAAIQLLLAVLFLSTIPLWRDDATPPASDTPHDTPETATQGVVKKDVRFWFCALIFFFYCAVEMSVGLWASPWLTRLFDVPEKAAGAWVACYWGGLTAGRFLIGAIANRVGNRHLIRYSVIVAILCGMVMWLSPSRYVVLAALVVLGFALASIFPCMMHEAPRRFDAATAAVLTGYQGGFAMIGYGCMPAVAGYVAQRTTFAILPYIVIAGSLVMLLLHIRVDGFHIPERKA